MKIKTEISDILNGRLNKIGFYVVRPLIMVMALCNVASLIVYSYDPTQFTNHFMYALIYYSGILFTVEYILRIWSSTVDPAGHHKRFGRLKYIFSFFGIIDFISILPFILPIFLSEKNELIEAINFTRVFLLLKILRYSRAFELLREVMRSARQELLMVLSIGSTVVTFAALLMYYIEREAQPEIFDNVGSGFWWAIITFSTVGYGDIYPVTDIGRFLAGLIAVIGIGMIAMPTAIISSSLMAKMDKHKARKMAELAAEKMERDMIKNHVADICPHCGADLSKPDDNTYQHEI